MPMLGVWVMAGPENAILGSQSYLEKRLELAEEEISFSSERLSRHECVLGPIHRRR